MPLILNNALPLHWAVAGAGIAAVTLCLLFVANRRLGISAGFEDVCALVLQQPYFARGSLRAARHWRLPLWPARARRISSAVSSGGWEPRGRRRARSGHRPWPAGKTGLDVCGRALHRVWHALAGGCTSGHGIFGMSNLELPSLVTTISFMAGGVVTTQLLYRVVFN
jgi:uncharacterized membrane protein YedE/YeeE